MVFRKSTLKWTWFSCPASHCYFFMAQAGNILTKPEFWLWGHKYFQTWGKLINPLQKLLTMFDLLPLESTRADWLCQGLSQDSVRLTLLKAFPVLASGGLACCVLHAASWWRRWDALYLYPLTREWRQQKWTDLSQQTSYQHSRTQVIPRRDE